MSITSNSGNTETPMRNRVLLLNLYFVLVLCGCQSVSYYSQAIDGQLNIMMNRQPISELLDDPLTPENLKNRLSLVLEIREFAQNKLHLPAENHYLSYVDLNRPYVVWNVFAAPEFSLTPKTWCYPVVGCVAYRGYFSEEAAHRYANGLRKRNYDVYVGGAIAYSTLGWFDDPVLSTIMYLSETESVSLIFHELAHQILYIPDDTAFNESFATAVEQEGMRRWLITKGDPETYNLFIVKYQRHRQFVDLIMNYRRQLESLYQSNLQTPEKKGQKAVLFNQLKRDYETLKNEWNGASGYDSWFRQALNNAKLVSVLTYQDFVPAFRKMMQKKDGDLKQFYAECLRVSQKSKTERYSSLTHYLDNQ
jgi:predicted aminopeptidase